MQYITGNMWQLATKNNGFVVVTTNMIVKNDGNAVMGAGVAKEAAMRFPDLPAKLGKHISRFAAQLYIEHPIICLPTKTDWKLQSDLDLIERGCIQLAMFGRAIDSVWAGENDHPPRVYLPKLGCGLGGLDWEKQVRPIVDSILEGDKFVLVSP